MSLTGSREKPPMTVGGWGSVRGVAEEMVLEVFEPRGICCKNRRKESCLEASNLARLGLFLFLLAFGDWYSLATHTVSD
jgi:hypothetical protein